MILFAYQKLSKKFIITQKSPAINIIIKDKSKFVVSHFGNKKNITSKTHKKLIIFPKTTENKENSIFINDCIKDKTDEFSKLKTEKIETINIEIIDIFVSYQGRKKASQIAKNIIKIHKINLKLKTFQIIFDALFLSFEISLIEIV